MVLGLRTMAELDSHPASFSELFSHSRPPVNHMLPMQLFGSLSDESLIAVHRSSA